MPAPITPRPGVLLLLTLWVVVLQLLGLALLARHLSAGERGAPVAAFSAERHEAGRKIYNFRCYYCHGYSGDARTLAASFLAPPPRDFSATRPAALPRERMIAAVSRGVPGTGMKGFAHALQPDEIAQVVDFVRLEFMTLRARNTRYHTPENGWPEHERYRIAFPFALGQIALDTPDERLDASQRAGLRLFHQGCISCHDRARVEQAGPVWDARPLSYPRAGYSHQDPPRPADAMTSASPYGLHDRKPVLSGLTPQEARGERLFQDNCAFCHAADGTGKNWIGSFMEPHPRNLTDPAFMQRVDRRHIARVIREGLAETSMPAWGDVLQADEIDAIIAYIDRAFHPIGRARPDRSSRVDMPAGRCEQCRRGAIAATAGATPPRAACVNPLRVDKAAPRPDDAA